MNRMISRQPASPTARPNRLIAVNKGSRRSDLNPTVRCVRHIIQLPPYLLPFTPLPSGEREGPRPEAWEGEGLRWELLSPRSLAPTPLPKWEGGYFVTPPGGARRGSARRAC